MSNKWINEDYRGVANIYDAIGILKTIEKNISKLVPPIKRPTAMKAINNVLAMLYNQEETAGWINVADALPLEHNTEMFIQFYGTPRWKKGMWATESNLVKVMIQKSDKSVTTLPHIKIREGKWMLPVNSVDVICWKPERPPEQPQEPDE